MPQYDIGPTPLQPHQPLDRFANRPMPAWLRRHIVGRIANFTAGIRHGHGQPAAEQNRHIGQIIADAAHFSGLALRARQEFVPRGPFIRATLQNRVDSEFVRTSFDRKRRTPRQNCHAITVLLPKLQARSIANVKPLDLRPIVGVHDAAIGEDAIDVEQQQTDFRSAFRKFSYGESNRHGDLG